METRKIYKSGGSTYVMSLPKKWVINSGLKEGDSVVTTMQKGSIIIEPGIVEKDIAKIEIKASEVPSSEMLERLIISYYLVGYDTIKIRLDKPESISYKKNARNILDSLIGIEIVEDVGNSITMEILLDHKRMPTIQVLRRIYLIIKSMLKDTIDALEKRDVSVLDDIRQREREVDRLYFLVVRQLKSSVRYQQVARKLGLSSQRDALGYRMVVKSYERIADHVENLIKSYGRLLEIDKSPDVKESIEIAKKVLEIYENSVKVITHHDIKIAEIVFEKLKKVEKKSLLESDRLFRKKVEANSALLQFAMLDSLMRIANYSSDIVEIALNLYVGEP